MADLTYRVQADWSQLERLREEISKTNAQMKQLKPDSPAEEFERLIKKHADLQNQYNDILASMGRMAIYAQEAFKKVGDAVKEELSHIGDIKGDVDGITSATEKRLAMEERVNETLRKMRDEVKAQKNQMLGKNNQEQEWEKVNEQLFVYEQMLESSDSRLDNLRNKVKDISKSTDDIDTQKIDETLDRLSSDKETFLDELIEKANNSIDNLNKLCDSADKLEESLSNNKGKTFDDIKQETEEYGNTLQKVSDAAGDAIKEQEAYIQGLQEKLDGITEKVNTTSDKTMLTELNRQAEELTFDLQNAEVTLEHIKRVKDGIDVKIADFQEVKDTVSAFDDLNKKTEQYVRILDNVKMGTEEATKAFEDYANKTTSISEDIKGSLKSIAAIAGVAFGLSEIKGFISNVASTREYFQDIESSMKVFLGNAEKSAEFTKKLKDYAWFNMFEFSDLAKASQQMIAYGQDVDTIIPKLDMLSNIAAGTHAPLMEMVDAYNRAKSTGVVDAMGIRSWATKGVVIKDVLREMGEQATSTQITFEQLNRVLEHLTGDGGMFHDLMKEQLNNISAEKGQLEDNLANMYNEIGEKLQGAITKWYKLQSDMVDNYQDFAGGEKTIDFVVNVAETGMDLLMDNWKQLIDIIKNAIAIYGSWRVALVAVSAVHKAQVALWKAEAMAANINSGAIVSNTIAKGQATAATVLLNNATKALNASMLASPLTWWAAGIAAVVYGIYTWVTAESSLEKGTRQANSELERQSELLDERKNNINNLIGVIKDQNQTEYAQYEAYKKIKAIAPEITDAYTRQQLAEMKLDEVQKLLNKDMSDNKYEQAKNNVEEYTKKVEEMQARYDRYQKQAEEGVDVSLAPDYVSSDMLETAIYQLEEYKKALKDVEETRKNALIEEENALLGDKTLIELGEAYKNIDEKAKNYTNSVIAAGMEMKQFGSISIEQANEIAEKHGLTAENIKKDFGDTYDTINKDITELEKSLDGITDPTQKRKIELEIARKKEQLDYIDNIRTQLNDIVRSPYQLRLNIVGKAQKWLMQLLKLAGFDVPADLEGNVEAQRDRSQSAQTAGEQASERYNKPRKSSKEYIDLQKKEEKKKASDYRKYKSGKGTINIQGTEYDLERLTVDENAKLEQYFKGADALLKKGEKDAKDAMQRRQKDYDMFLKNREQQLEQEKKAQNAAEEARIASIENATIREREAKKNQFRLTEQSIRDQEEAFKKSNVEQQKQEWANKKENKDKIWADTALAQDIKKNGYDNVNLTAAQYQQLAAMRDKNWKEEQRFYEESNKALIASHQSYIDQKIEIENGYNKYVASAEKALAELRIKLATAKPEEERNRIQGEIDSIIRSIAEAGKDMQKKLSSLAMSELQDSPFYSLAWKDLGRVSTSVLNTLLSKFNDLQGQFANNPEAMKVWAEKITTLTKELANRNPWTVLSNARKQLETEEQKQNGLLQDKERLEQIISESQLKLEQIKKLRDYQVANRLDTTDTDKREEEVRTEMKTSQEQLNNVMDEYGSSLQKSAEAQERLKAAMQAVLQVGQRLSSSIKNLGNAVGGTAGEVLNVFGGVMDFAQTVFDGVEHIAELSAKTAADTTKKVADSIDKTMDVTDKAINETVDITEKVSKTADDIMEGAKTAVEKTGEAIEETVVKASTAMRALETASVILAIISAAIQLIQQISALLPNAFDQYEKYRDKVNEINKATQAVRDYKAAVLEAQQAEENWFSTTGLKNLTDQYVLSNNALSNYYEAMTADKAIYEVESGSGWLTKLGAMANKTWASITGWVNNLFGIEGTFIGDLATHIAQFGWANLAGGMVGMNMFLENEIWKKNFDRAYEEGMTAAWQNLWIETRSSSKGFLGTGVGGHDQEVENLIPYVKEQLGLDLFGEDGFLDLDAYQQVIEKFGDRLVGETKEILEELAKYKEEYDKFQEALEEYISDMYSPLTDSMTDALWDFYDTGRDVMDSFKEYSVDVFQSIGKEMVKSMVNNLLFDNYKDQLQKLYTSYSVARAAGMNEEDALRELSDGMLKATDNFLDKAEQEIPILQNAVEHLREGLEARGLDVSSISQQSATANSIQNISYDQADSLVGILLGHTIIFEQIKAILENWDGGADYRLSQIDNSQIQTQEMTLLNANAELIYAVNMEQRDIAADSRDILAGMAIHVEEIRDGVVDTIVPRIKNIDDNLVKVYRLVEEQ